MEITSEFKGNYHICVSAIAVALNLDCFSPGLHRISKFISQRLHNMLFKVFVRVGITIRVGSMKRGLFILRGLLHVIVELAVIADDDVNITFGINIGVVSIRTLKKNLEIAAFVRGINVL